MTRGMDFEGPDAPACDLCTSTDYTLRIYGVCNNCVAGLINQERDRLHAHGPRTTLEQRKPR